MNTEIVKVTMKSKKENMVQSLRDCYDLVGQHDANLANEVKFMLDNANSANKTDIFDVVQKVQKLISSVEQPTLFNDDRNTEDDSKKDDNKKNPALKNKNAGKSEPSTKEKTKKNGTTEHLKKPSVNKKKDGKVDTVKQMSGIPVAKLFPETLEIKIGEAPVKLKRAEKYNSIEEIVKAVDEGKYIYFATFWTARLLQEYEYAYTNHVAENLCESFPNDLDILEMSLTCKFVERVWAMSIYTDALFRFDNKEIKYISDRNQYTGEQYKVRVSNGMEFEVYEEVIEDTTE